MNIITPLIPVAATALDSLIHGVGELVDQGNSFADFLGEQFHAKAEFGKSSSSEAPQPSELGQQLQRQTHRQGFEQLREKLHAQLAKKFADNGISLSDPVVLVPGHADRILEAGNHWDRAAIEGLLESDAQLRSDIRQLLDQGSNLWGSGPIGSQNGRSGSARLVVSDSEIFFQVV